MWGVWGKGGGLVRGAGGGLDEVSFHEARVVWVVVFDKVNPLHFLSPIARVREYELQKD